MKKLYVDFEDRGPALKHKQNLKMARSAHAYMRGSTVQFYRWLAELKKGDLPEGPPIWICGDCHVGNLGPLGKSEGGITIGIRDPDQTVIGNPAHDLIRLALSLASAARGSDLPGVATALMMGAMMQGYSQALSADTETGAQPPKSVHTVIRKAVKRTWRHLAKERIEDTSPAIPLGERFWPMTDEERSEIERLFDTEHVRRLATMLRDRDDDALVRLVDAAYWRKGCSSLGRLRYCVLLQVGKKDPAYCLMDIKEAVAPAAPRYSDAMMPGEPAARVIEGACHLTPALGDRMRKAILMGRSVFVRELLPQDLKIELETLPAAEALEIAHYLAAVVGRAHARQMDSDQRRSWAEELKRAEPADLDAPSWLWRSVVDLLALHERAYLEHCRRYALEGGQPF